MFELIDHIQHRLEPRLSQHLRARFALMQRQAEQALPTLAWIFLAELRWILLHPKEHVLLLAGLVAFLTEPDPLSPDPTTPEVALGLALGVLAARRDVLTQILGATVGLNEEVAEQAMHAVLPAMMHGLRAQTQRTGLRTMLRPLLAEQPAMEPAQVEALITAALAAAAQPAGAGTDRPATPRPSRRGPRNAA